MATSDSASCETNCRERVNKWFKSGKQIKILVSGKPGVGKSTLINGFVGKNVARPGSSLQATTTNVRAHPFEIDGVHVILYDTPGVTKSVSRDTIKEIKERCIDVDLFIFCIKMSEARLIAGGEDSIAMRLITEALGKEVWKNGMVVLTFANEAVASLEANCATDNDMIELFSRRFERVCTRTTELIESQVEQKPSEVTNKIAFVPASITGDNLLPAISEVQKCGVDKFHWLSYLWLKAIPCAKGRAQPTLVKINRYRLKNFRGGYQREEIRYLIMKVADTVHHVCKEWGTYVGSIYCDNDETIGKKVGEEIGRVEMMLLKDELIDSIFETSL